MDREDGPSGKVAALCFAPESRGDQDRDAPVLDARVPEDPADRLEHGAAFGDFRVVGEHDAVAGDHRLAQRREPPGMLQRIADQTSDLRRRHARRTLPGREQTFLGDVEVEPLILKVDRHPHDRPSVPKLLGFSTTPTDPREADRVPSPGS